VRSGETIASPPIGQSLRFLATTEETRGERLRFEASLEPGSFMPPHIHRFQEERLEVLEGEGEFLFGRRRRRVGPGDTLTVPARRAHAFRTLGGSARLIAELRPALDTEEVFAALFALGRAGRINRFGAPSARQAATLMHRHPDAFFFLPVIPPGAQLALARPLAAPRAA